MIDGCENVQAGLVALVTKISGSMSAKYETATLVVLVWKY